MKVLTVVCCSLTNPITKVTEMLGRRGIDIRDIHFKQIGETAFLSLAVGDYDQSLALLAKAGYTVVSDEVVLLRGEDRPGALAEMARLMTEQGVDIRSLTPMANISDGAVIVVSTSNNAKVRSLFADLIVN